MAKVHFAPYSAVKYVGSKAKELSTSLARPKPILKKGDIVIVEKKDAFNLVTKGYGDFVFVDVIEFKKGDVATSAMLDALEAGQKSLQEHNAKLSEELAVALAALAEHEDKTIDEAFGVVPEVEPERAE